MVSLLLDVLAMVVVVFGFLCVLFLLFGGALASARSLQDERRERSRWRDWGRL